VPVSRVTFRSVFGKVAIVEDIGKKELKWGEEGRSQGEITKGRLGVQLISSIEAVRGLRTTE